MSFLLPLCAFVLAVEKPAFALRDGDTVVFLGDSITAARTYSKLIEQYTLLRFPDRKVRFVNSGWGGDTAAGGLARLDLDVFAHGATVLIVAYGVNDIGWGTKADEEHKQKYLAGIRGIVERCREKKVRVFIGSAAVTGADPAKSETDFLQKMCDEGMQLSRSLGGEAIDIQRTMRGIQRRLWAANENAKGEKHTLHAADGVHLNDLGQLAMAYAILKGLGAPRDVSSVHVNIDGLRVEAEDCRVRDVTWREGRLEFTRSDAGLPFNYGIFYALNYRFVPVPDELGRYMLRVEGLPEGRYSISADGRSLGTFPSAHLARGVNLMFATADAWQAGGPWDAQATVVKSLNDARHDLAVAALMARVNLPADGVPKETAEGMARADGEIVALQRQAAKPRPYRFVVSRAEEKPAKP